MKYKEIADKNNFSFQYKLISKVHDGNLVNESQGVLKLWVNGTDICEYTFEGKLYEYEASLVYIIEWLCENVKYIIGYDPFPLPVDGKDINDIWEKVYTFEGNELEESLWFDANSEWLFRHTWMNVRGNSILSNICFRRIENYIEVSWDNTCYEKVEIYFSQKKGSFLINRLEFIEIIVDFFKKIIEDLRERSVNSPESLKWIEQFENNLKLCDLI